MGITPEVVMFKRFGAPNARNLLYMQNELMFLEAKLKMAEAADAAAPKSEKQNYRKDFWCLLNSEIIGPDTIQIDLVRRIRDLLKEYNNALLQQRAIYQLKEPSKIDMDDIQNFLGCDHMNSVLFGMDYAVWGSILKPKDYDKELVVLRSRKGTDIFSRWLGSHALKYITTLGCARYKKVNAKYGTIATKDANVYKFTFACTSIIASLLPVLSIIALVLLDNMKKRIAIIAAFNVAISALLTMFTEAKRTDVFAVTAAFAAVQVVFDGSALDNEPKQVVIAAGGALPNCTCP